MKKVFSGLLLVFAFPFRILKKSKIDNFIGGLIFGALFSLFVNIVTVNIQERVQKQRMLEAIENEIAMNMVYANTTITKLTQLIKDNTPMNSFYSAYEYSSDIWTQSSEPLSYIAQLDQVTQQKIIPYYLISMKYANNFVNKSNELVTKSSSICYSDELIFNEQNREKCIAWSQLAYETELSAAEDMSKNSFDVLKVFHPTQDRLNSWFLRTLMGDKSTTLLSGLKK